MGSYVLPRSWRSRAPRTGPMGKNRAAHDADVNMDAPSPRRTRPIDRARNGTRRGAVAAVLKRALAVMLVVVAYGFLGAVPHPPSAALGTAYAASALCLAIAAWRLWRQTFA